MLFSIVGAVQLAGLSVSGAKWIRYSLPLLPFLYLAGGYAVQQTLKAAKGKVLSQALVGLAAVILIGWPLLELQSWAPYYSFYLNSIGGEKQNITRYFAMDEVSEFDTREVAQNVCPFAPVATTVATARPMSMAYYLQACGREDLRIVPLYDTHYAPQDGDLMFLSLRAGSLRRRDFSMLWKTQGCPIAKSASDQFWRARFISSIRPVPRPNIVRKS